jgi:hypothetical protein
LGCADDSDARQRKHYHVRQEKNFQVILIFVSDSPVIRQPDLAICRSLALARAAFAAAISEKPAARFMIRSRTRVVKRYPEGNW